jgi:hypothetical protein
MVFGLLGLKDLVIESKSYLLISSPLPLKTLALWERERVRATTT